MLFKRILVDSSVEDHYLTKLILSRIKCPTSEIISSEEAASRLNGTHPAANQLPDAKRILLLTRNPGSFFKYMGSDPGVTDCQRASSTRFDLYQGCPLDCHYCFCQQYLSCHHVVAFTNVRDALNEPGWKDIQHTSTRLVTGDIADSLALGEISVLIHEYAAQLLPHAKFELRSKFKLPDNFTRLDSSRFRLDWSLSPDAAWRINEPGSAAPAIRIDSIRRALKSGFEVGIRLDPLQNDPGQTEQINFKSYELLLKNLKNAICPDQPLGFIVGSYKLTSDLKMLIRRRFPENPLSGQEWTRCSDGKLRPFRTHRLNSYRTIIKLLHRFFPGIPIDLSMELPFILNLLDI